MYRNFERAVLGHLLKVEPHCNNQHSRKGRKNTMGTPSSFRSFSPICFNAAISTCIIDAVSIITSIEKNTLPQGYGTTRHKKYTTVISTTSTAYYMMHNLGFDIQKIQFFPSERVAKWTLLLMCRM